MNVSKGGRTNKGRGGEKKNREYHRVLVGKKHIKGQVNHGPTKTKIKFRKHRPMRKGKHKKKITDTSVAGFAITAGNTSKNSKEGGGYR